MIWIFLSSYLLAIRCKLIVKKMCFYCKAAISQCLHVIIKLKERSTLEGEENLV